jgi:lipopolysaccharide/colanic/teichoic acid biosynthesis glycosyltransferase
MKRGAEYLGSTEKRRLDRALLVLTFPAVAAAELVVKQYVASAGITDSHIFDQERVGKAGQPFTIHKFLTLHPETGEPISPFAARFRKLGLDELAQARNIQEGTMSFAGWRPIVPEEYEAFRDALPPKLGMQHDFVMANSLPGDVSTYGIYSHIRQADEPDSPEIRAEMNIKDFIDASLANDLRLAQSLVAHAVSRRLT